MLSPYNIRYFSRRLFLEILARKAVFVLAESHCLGPLRIGLLLTLQMGAGDYVGELELGRSGGGAGSREWRVVQVVLEVEDFHSLFGGGEVVIISV